jgi:uncharacterized protein involved in outer membrane biogenesis
MSKKFITVLLVLVAIIGGAVIYVKNNLDSIVKTQLEKYGSLATKTDVNIDHVKISLVTGEGSVTGINIGNPKSYVSAKAITLGDVTMKLDTSTIPGSGPIVIKSITIDKPYITYEMGAAGNSNLQDIQHNVAGTPSKAEPKKSVTSSGYTRKVIIKDVYITNGKVTLTQSMLKGQEMSTNLPPLHLRNIGKPGEGATGTEVAKQVITPLAAQAAQVGSQAFAGQIANLKNLNTKDLKQKGQDALKGLLGK